MREIHASMRAPPASNARIGDAQAAIPVTKKYRYLRPNFFVTVLAGIFHMEHETDTLRSRRGNETDARTPLGIRPLTSAATNAVNYPG
jgi:hypothetical protein